MAEGVAAHQKFRSPSIMHGAQMPVTRSNQPLTLEEVHEKKHPENVRQYINN